MKTIQSGGIDTAYISVWADWHDEYWIPFQKQIEEKKQSARNNGEPLLTLGRQSWIVRAGGVRMGVAGGPVFPWVMDANDVTLLFREKNSPQDNLPTLRIQLGSINLMRSGSLGNSFWPVLTWLMNTFQIEIKHATISRIDVCADLPGADIAEYQEIVHKRHYITRASKCEFYKLQDDKKTQVNTYRSGLRSTGFRIGGSALMMRGYEKVEEMNVKNDAIKRAVMQEFRYGKPTDKAVRIEFQIRRAGGLSRLNIGSEQGIAGVEDWIEKEADICKYLTHDWFRMTKGKYDGHHKQKTHRLWKKVQEAFHGWAGDSTQPVSRVQRRVHPDPHELEKQGIGCLRKAALTRYPDLASKGEFLAIISDAIENIYATEESFQKAVLLDRFDLAKRIDPSALRDSPRGGV